MSENVQVLIIEDEPLWSNYLEVALKKLGYQVAGKAGGLEEAISMLTTTTFDVALVDINLDGKRSGIELGKLIAQAYKRPFIFITSDVSEAIMKEVAAAGPASYLSKPVSTTALMVAINNALTDRDSEELPIQHNDSFFVKVGNAFKRVKWEDVVCLSVSQNYTQVHTTDTGATLLIRSPLHKTLTDVVPYPMQNNFLKINRGQAINATFINELHGSTIVTAHGNFDVTDTHLQEVKRYLNLIA